MIQDMLNPEYYSSSFKIINSENDEFILRKAKYQSSTKNLKVRIMIHKKKKKIEIFIYTIYSFCSLEKKLYLEIH